MYIKRCYKIFGFLEKLKNIYRNNIYIWCSNFISGVKKYCIGTIQTELRKGSSFGA